MIETKLLDINPSARIFELGRMAFTYATGVSYQAIRCISEWSKVEICVLSAGTDLLGGVNGPILLEAVLAIKSSSAQGQALEAALRSSVSEEDRNLVAATLLYIRSVGKFRNKLAHWLWASSQDIGHEDLILINPNRYLRCDYVENEIDPEVVKFRLSDDWKKDALLITSKGLYEYLEQCSLCCYYTNFLRMLGNENPERVAQGRKTLSRVPEIQLILSRHRRND
ncbi:hypothetical protein JK203_08920 [Gluconobacter cerinus]|uniref:hypothetical protein n=1 Tax=Gluconobacter cerinus TaxID=38307 RepID=UPI001B8D7C62|nr:hypothetical protein [Gluconobacter cerinus]MBS1040970.1 hypothetical protein [Gluconobacter cerinus]MBS1047969.1 hypothetical protein [Gluconobacter cerinus]